MLEEGVDVDIRCLSVLPFDTWASGDGANVSRKVWKKGKNSRSIGLFEMMRTNGEEEVEMRREVWKRGATGGVERHFTP